MKKRILCFVLVLSIIFSLTCECAFAMTPQEGANWALAQIGKRIDTDGRYGAQCVDLIVQYCKTNFGWNPQGSGNAEAYRTVTLPNSSWKRIQNTPDFIPQPGDIAIWNPTSGNGYCGHVAIVVSANINNFVSVDQNWYGANGTTGSPAAQVTHNYSGFWGVIRPPFSNAEDSNQAVHSTTSATVRDGFFTIKNVSSGKYLNVYGGIDADKTPITVWEYDDSTDQQFNIVHKGGGKYKLHAYCSGIGTNRVVDVFTNGAAPAAGQLIDLYTPNDDIAQLFYIVPLSDGSFVFELASKDGYVIAPASASAAGVNGSQLTLQLYTGASHQKWKLCNNNGGETHPMGAYGFGAYTINTNGINLVLRSGAGTGYSKVTSVPDGTTLNVTQVNGNWGYASYNGYSGWICLDYTAYAPTITSICIKTPPHTVAYYVGDELDTTDMEIDVVYSNGSTRSIIDGYSTSYDFSTPGTKTVTVSYEGKYTTFTVEVKPIEISDLVIESMPSKTKYYTGDMLDTEGLSLKAIYNNNSSRLITSGFEATYDFSEAGTKTVTITYEGLSVSYDVIVENAGSAFVSVDATQNVYYNDEITAIVSLSDTQNIYDGNFDVKYDNSVLELIEVKAESVLGNSNCLINENYDENSIRVVFAGTKQLSTGNMLTLKFKVISDKTSQTYINIENLNMYDINGTLSNTKISNGKTNIHCYDYTITGHYMLDSEDKYIQKIPQSGEFYVGISFNKNSIGTSRPTVIYGIYDDNDKLIALSTEQNRYSKNDDLICETLIEIPDKVTASYIKCFIWDSVLGLNPLSRTYMIK